MNLSQLPWHPKSLTFREGKALGGERPPKGHSQRQDFSSLGRTQGGTAAGGAQAPSEGMCEPFPSWGLVLDRRRHFYMTATAMGRHVEEPLLPEGFTEGKEQAAVRRADSLEASSQHPLCPEPAW